MKKKYKYFIGYVCGDYKAKPLHIMLPKTRAHVQSYDGQTKWIYFFWLKMMTYWKNIILFGIKSVLIFKWIDSEPVYNKIFFQIKIKSYCDETTDCHKKEIPKVGPNHSSLTVITINSVFKTDENYYPQVLLKKYR